MVVGRFVPNAKYGEAARQLASGAQEWRRQQQEEAAKAEKERLKELEEEEDAAWAEEMGDDGAW